MPDLTQEPPAPTTPTAPTADPEAAAPPATRSLSTFAEPLKALADALAAVGDDATDGVERVADDVAAARHHAAAHHGVAVVALLGGTGTGKSTLCNRIIGAPDRGDQAITATSFRRTHTAGCVAIAPDAEAVPDGWLGVPARVTPPDELPARGTADRLAVVVRPGMPPLVLIDTPDLDGDRPEHHKQAERAFRWAHAVVLVATPEKYQLPEASIYARLANRYRLPRRFVLNKADDLAAADDWADQLGDGLPEGQVVHVVPRDDSSVAVVEQRSLTQLKRALPELKASDADRAAGLAARCGDIAGRAVDSVLSPLRDRRDRAERARGRLRALVRPEAGVNVHPMTRHLQRRLRQQSVLYLMGPQRMLDRVRSVPSLVARLPRTTWDLVTKGKLAPAEKAGEKDDAGGAPNFRGELVDSFHLLQTRAADVLRDCGLPDDMAGWRLPEAEAGEIATRELAELQRWLEARWDAKPRDTRALEWLAKNVPGAKHIAKLSEAAPYLLASVSFATSTFSMGADQVIIGGYLLTTWLGEQLSNEVAAKTRETNAAIRTGFEELCNRQVQAAADWAESLAPGQPQLDALERAIEAVEHAAHSGRSS